MVQILDATANADTNGPVAFVLPGAGYPALAPLLYWPVGILRSAGWRVFTASWDEDDRRSTSLQQMVEHALDQLTAQAGAIAQRPVRGLHPHRESRRDSAHGLSGEKHPAASEMP